MRRAVLFMILMLGFFAKTEASHILGGEIYYDKVAGAQHTYKVTLLVYRDMTGVAVSQVQTLKVSDSTTFFVLPTPNSGYKVMVSCDDSIEVHEFVNDSVYLGPIPATGLSIGWERCCRPGGISNLSLVSGFYIGTTMYPLPGKNEAGNSVRFFNPINNVGNAISSQFFNYAAFDPDAGDSIYIEMDYVEEYLSQIDSVVTVPYVTGYTKSNPFGAQSVSFNSHTGLMTVIGAPKGRYVTSFLAKSYTNGILTSTTDRDVPFFFGSSSPINAKVDILNFSGTAKVTKSGNNYIVAMHENDSVSFIFEGQHVYMVDSVVPDVTLLATGPLFSNTTGTVGPCMGNNCATFDPINGGFTNQGLSMAEFKLNPNTSFVEDHGSFHTLSFFGYSLDSCRVLRGENIGVQIIVYDTPLLSGASRHGICFGDSVQTFLGGDTTGVTWSPSSGVSNPNSASPWLSPTTTTTYTVTNAKGDSVKILVSVQNIQPFSLIQQGNWLQIPSLHPNQTMEWYYNGAKMNVYNDSLEMTVSGSYWASVSLYGCKVYSDTVTSTIANKVANTSPDGDGIHTNATSATASFEFVTYANTIEKIELINPSIVVGKTGNNVDINIHHENGTLIWSGPAKRKSFQYWETEIISPTTKFDPGVEYTIEITSDIQNWVLFQPHSFPYIDPNGVIKINKGSHEDNGTKNNAVPYLNLVIGSHIGLDENDLKANIYPNPTHDHITILIPQPATFTLMNTRGEMVLHQEVFNREVISTSHLSSGVYIYQIQNDLGMQTGKLVIE